MDATEILEDGCPSDRKESVVFFMIPEDSVLCSQEPLQDPMLNQFNPVRILFPLI